ncbi:hypothetical protein ACTMTF_45740 [Nonomuraea sp. ZG12]
MEVRTDRKELTEHLQHGYTSGRWHVAFAAIPEPVPAPGAGEVVGWTGA